MDKETFCAYLLMMGFKCENPHIYEYDYDLPDSTGGLSAWVSWRGGSLEGYLVSFTTILKLQQEFSSYDDCLKAIKEYVNG